jgi:hypothetical protein
MPAGAGGLARARPFGEHSNDRHQEAKEQSFPLCRPPAAGAFWVRVPSPR